MADNICFGCMSEKGTENVCPTCGWVNDSAPESPLHLKPGTILKGQYLIGRVLGHGGFGITYLACDINLGTKLAIKEYFPQGMATRGTGDPTISVYSGNTKEHFEYGLDKFLDEARTLSKFDDVSEITSIKDFFKENGTAYIVMSYIDGITLKEYVEMNGGKLPLDAALNIMLPVMKALEHVHKAGILHRDISPDNIYITKRFSVKLLDFGAARFAMGEHSKSLSVLLKPGYAPEEQYRTKGRQGPWTDVYAVAATMYKVLTGLTPPEALDRLEEDTLVPPSRQGVSIPGKMEVALLKALSLRAVDRYQTMPEFYQAFQATAITEKEADEAISEKLEMKEENQEIPVKKTEQVMPSTAIDKKALKWVVGGTIALLLVIAIYGLSRINTKDEVDTPAPVYQMVDLGCVGSYSIPSSINEKGQITMISSNSSFLYENGEMKSLDALGEDFDVLEINNTGHIVGNDEESGKIVLYENGVIKVLYTTKDMHLTSINEKGQIAGYTSSGAGIILYEDGATKELGTLGGKGSAAYSINNNGQIVGQSDTSSGDSHAYLYENDVMKDLGTLGGKKSRADSLNDKGQIVGRSDTSSGDSHAFLYENGAMKDLGTLGGKESEAYSINNNGQIVGQSDTSSGEKHAFLYENGVMKDLGTLGGKESMALSINENGEIVGDSEGADSKTHAFLYKHIN